MPIEMECPNPDCDQTLTAPDDLAGSRVRCPACKTIFRLRAEGAEPRTHDLADEPRAPAVSTPPPAPQSPAFNPPPMAPPVRPAMGPYGPYPGYYPQRAEGKTVAALVLGIIAVVPCWLHPLWLIFSIPCGVLGIVFGRGQLNRVGRGEIPPTNEAMARAGFVCGLVGLILGIAVGIFWAIFLSVFISSF